VHHLFFVTNNGEGTADKVDKVDNNMVVAVGTDNSADSGSLRLLKNPLKIHRETAHQKDKNYQMTARKTQYFVPSNSSLFFTVCMQP
jgi:hypothetical protein